MDSTIELRNKASQAVYTMLSDMYKTRRNSTDNMMVATMAIIIIRTFFLQKIQL